MTVLNNAERAALQRIECRQEAPGDWEVAERLSRALTYGELPLGDLVCVLLAADRQSQDRLASLIEQAEELLDVYTAVDRATADLILIGFRSCLS